jgi:hypothetical protein
MQKRRTARAEVFRHAEEIVTRMNCGETVVYIYDDLLHRREITCAYRTFAQWARRFYHQENDQEGRPLGRSLFH